jgi:tetratricopeptide (TPR) repeat protein
MGSRSLQTAIAPIVILIVVLAAIGLVFGPPAATIAEFYTIAQHQLFKAADWYQKSLEGSAKLLAPLFTILSGAYAIYKSYKYAESRLHFRLKDFLDREEKRLSQARPILRALVERPGLGRDLEFPAFLSDELADAVRELGWGSYFLPPQMGFVEFQLSAAIEQLTKQNEIARRNLHSLKSQLATAHLLKGAIEASRGSTLFPEPKVNSEACDRALAHFQEAFKADKTALEALEYSSLMHLCLGDRSEAEAALNKLIGLTTTLEKSLVRSRAFRYQAELAINDIQPKPLIASIRLKDALRTLPNLHGTDMVEEAELHEMIAMVPRT